MLEKKRYMMTHLVNLVQSLGTIFQSNVSSSSSRSVQWSTEPLPQEVSVIITYTAPRDGQPRREPTTEPHRIIKNGLKVIPPQLRPPERILRTLEKLQLVREDTKTTLMMEKTQCLVDLPLAWEVNILSCFGDVEETGK